jgi:hypothetical protein
LLSLVATILQISTYIVPSLGWILDSISIPYLDLATHNIAYVKRLRLVDLIVVHDIEKPKLILRSDYGVPPCLPSVMAIRSIDVLECLAHI